MAVEIVVALIGLGGSALGSIIGIAVNSKMVNYRLEQLEDKVNEHNNVIARTYKVESRLDVHDETISSIKHRIEDLEKETHDFSDNKFIKEH